MKLTELFLEQLEAETKSTRRALERVPEGRNDWKPHEKSMAMGYLAALVAKMPGWIAMMIDSEEYELTSQDARFQPKELNSNRELLASFDEAVASARKALQNTTDEHLQKRWRMLVNGSRCQRLAALCLHPRRVFTHLGHHRGQLTVYLRLNEAPVPSIYGPSADERGFLAAEKQRGWALRMDADHKIRGSQPLASPRRFRTCGNSTKCPCRSHGRSAAWCECCRANSSRGDPGRRKW